MKDLTFQISECVCKRFIRMEKELAELVQVHVATDEVLLSREYEIC